MRGVDLESEVEMNKEFKELLKDFIIDPVSAEDKLNDANYQKVLSKKVYEYHKRYKGDKPWNEYIIDVLYEDYQINNFYIGDYG